MRHIHARVASLGVVILGCGGAGDPGIEGVFDLYQVGVHRAALEIGADRYRVRWRDAADGSWSEWASAPAGEAGSHDAFDLPGSLDDLIEGLPSMAGVDWGRHPAVAWPDEGTTWLPHGDGSEGGATRWYVPGASRPMDLIIGADDELLAASDLRDDVVLVRRGHEDLTTVGRWRDPAIAQPVHGYEPLPKAMVRGDDGVGLATLVYLPAGDRAMGPFPTILVRTPYGISNLISGYWHYAVRGYAVVLQATRGTAYWDPDHRSEGAWDPMIDEPADGARAVEWITEQPWSDGRVCMQGGSYVGYTQWSASMAANPALRCLVPESSMGTAFSDQPYMGGGFVEGLAYYLFWMLDKPIRPGLSWTEILHHRPLMELDDHATGEDVPQWNALLRHWRNDEYWQRQNWYAAPGPRDFGTLQISGWFDDDFPGTRANWELMQQSGTAPQRLIIGPWRHGYNTDRALNGFDFGADAVRDDIWLAKQQWYDQFLGAGDPDPVERRVDYFVLGENRWRQASTWPPGESTPRRWYFHSSGEANRLTTDGLLTGDAPASAEPPDRYRYDPEHPPANWHSFDLLESWEDVQSFPYDFKDIEARPDVVTYTTPVLAEDVTIAGDVKVVLYASTDVMDTDWWVHLADVHPDNRSIRLTVGMLRARFRNLDDPDHQIAGDNFTREELLSGNPADVVRYEIAIPSIANTFRAGHRIRVAVMNALDNYSFPNSNTGGDEALATTVRVGDMVIHHGPEHPSHVVLDVLPPGT